MLSPERCAQLTIQFRAEARSCHEAYTQGRRTAESGLPPNLLMVQVSKSYSSGYRDWYTDMRPELCVRDLTQLYEAANASQLDFFTL